MKQKYLLKTLLLTSFFLFAFNSFGQAINDNFDDGNITGWTEGTASHWTSSTTSPITGTNSLKHNLSGVSNESYIYHDISSLDLTTQDVTWQFNIKNGNWDPSSGNRFWVYLTANETDLLGNTVDGYAVGVNLTGTTDIVTLWKVTNGAADGAVITSALDWNANTTVGFRITRTSVGLWELSLDSDGGFDNLVSAGNATNTDYTHDGSFGLSFDFSSSRAGFLWMDDVLVQGAAPSSDPTIGFDAASSGVTETDADVVTAGIPISLINHAADVTITPTVNGSSTAEAGDYTIDLTPIVFNANETNNIPLTIKDDADMDNETIVIDFTVTSGTATLATSQHTVTITDDEIQDIVITEIMYNTPSPGSDDEWIELYNDENSSIDLNGWSLEYASNTYNFVAATVIPSKSYITIALGSSNSGNNFSFNADFPFEPDFNTLGHATNIALVTTTAGADTNKLTNSTATITLKNASTTIVDTVTYDDADTDGNHDGNGNSLEIIDVNADNTDPTTANWRSSSNNGGSPGASITSTWTGTTSGVWNLAGNWDNGIPTTTINAIIPVIADITKRPTASVDISAKYLVIESGASLIVQSNTVSAEVTYKANVSDTNWHLMSSPVVGEQHNDDWNTLNFINVSGAGNNDAVSTYDNTTDADGDWNYFQTGGASTTFDSGKGYSLKRTASGDYRFTGTFPDQNVVSTITQGAGGANKWNFVGNPFPSYIRASELITANATNLTDTHEFVYVWDNSENGGAGGYKAIAGADYIHPSQGFFVNADNSAANNFTMAESLQSHQNGITFLS